MNIFVPTRASTPTTEHFVRDNFDQHSPQIPYLAAIRPPTVADDIFEQTLISETFLLFPPGGSIDNECQLLPTYCISTPSPNM